MGLVRNHTKATSDYALCCWKQLAGKVTLIVDSQQRPDLKGPNGLLVENGHGVYQLSFEQESLEDIFLTLTAGAGQ